ncbi:MAG: hypothetical protein QM803_20385 [Rhodocyclaceae bacterium]
MKLVAATRASVELRVVNRVDVALFEQYGFLVWADQDCAERMVAECDRTTRYLVGMTKVANNLFTRGREPLCGKG